MANLEEEIPAFSRWIMCRDNVIPALLNMEYSELSLQKLANIVKTNEFLTIFVYAHDSSLTFEQSEAISKKYKTFTFWLLGRFFYSLSRANQPQMHEVILDIQWQILHYICITQPHIYKELSAEYSLALSQLNEHHRHSKDEAKSQTVLEIFVPLEDDFLKTKFDLTSMPVEISSQVDCSNLQSKMIKFVHRILHQNIKLFFFNSITYQILDSLLYVLSECSIELKFAVLEVYVGIFKEYEIYQSNMPYKFVEKFNRFIDYIEPLVYHVYNKRVDLSALELTQFEGILVVFFKYAENLERVSLRIQNMARFIIFNEVAENLQKICCEQICKLQTSVFQHPNLVEDCINRFLENDAYYLLKIVAKQIVFEVRTHICSNANLEVNLCSANASITWHKFDEDVRSRLHKNGCTKNRCCLLLNLTRLHHVLEMLVCVRIEVQNYLVTKQKECLLPGRFFSESDLMTCIFDCLNHHLEICGEIMATEVNKLLHKMFTMVPAMCSVDDSEFMFLCVAYPLLKQSELVKQIKLGQNQEYAKLSNRFFVYLMHKQYLYSENDLFDVVGNISAGLLIAHGEYRKMEKVETFYFNTVKNILSSSNEISCKLLKTILQFPSVFHHRNQWINQILLPAFEKQSNKTICIEAMMEIICKSHSQYVPVVSWKLGDKFLQSEMFCLTCTKQLRDLTNKNQILNLLLEKFKFGETTSAAFEVFPPLPGGDDVLYGILQRVLRLSTYGEQRVNLQIVRSLKALAHLSKFHTIETTKLWLQFAGDDDKEVRLEFVRVLSSLIENVQNNTNLSEEYKEEMLQNCFSELKTFTKNSLQHSNFELQDTILESLRQISFLKMENTTHPIVQLLLYFIMIPTSKYSLIAGNIFIRMANQYNSTPKIIYCQYKKELSQSIVNLAAINQALLNYNLATSLEKISLILGFFGPKDFVTQESKYLLPFLVALIITMPKVTKLIQEVSVFVELDLSELLITKFGHIFPHLFLTQSDEGFKKCMGYIETITGLNGFALRKGNFQVILNELLLNFNEKKDRVLLAVRIMAREDTEAQTLSISQIPAYLHPRFLGVLAYFDLKLIAKRNSAKEKVLLSLAQLLRFMGPKHITPLRFKILAMLRTALNLDYESFPELNCDVWDAFVRSCEKEALGPQLASIFVSLLPLMQHFPEKIDGIFRYLVIENEVFVRDFIPDLFFVVEADVNNEICVVINKYLQRIEVMSFKEQLKNFLKYLSHETIELRVHGLKHLKRLLEKNREELDRMILGYNGIDPAIVELLDILMLGCREKEECLKLACGECIGELGAIEPSHLPRQHTQEAKSFMFFITEDAFIINALNELTRALQAEKHTQNMDRFALAIQETLKLHGISPDSNSPKHNLWVNFPDAQRELMLPLLSSRYTMVQSLEHVPVSPIYRSKFGATFQSWIHNWTCNLILAINSDKRSRLQVCFPALKQDHKTLMNFLPHILLHALLENPDIHQTTYDEFMAVINTFNNKQQLKPHVSSVRRIPSNASLSTQSTPAQELTETQCTKVIFVLLDFLDRWKREWVWEKGALANEDSQHQTINEFLSRFCKLQLARSNYQCGEYPRALMYIEEYIKEQPNALCNQFEFLAELYAQLDEPDGVAGVIALQDTEPPLEQRLLALEVSGKLADAAACYEQIPPPLKPHHLQGLVQCYLDLNNVNTALNFAEGAIERQPEYKNLLVEIQAEPLWRLGRYTELDSLLKKPELETNNKWGVQVGRTLLHLKEGRRNDFKNVLDSLRLAQVESLGAASLEEGAYQHGYSFIAKLHTLNELQQVECLIYELLARPNDHKVCESKIKQLTSEWELRLKVVQESIRIQEPILCLRRVAINQAKELLQSNVPDSIPLLNSLLGESWLLSATIARAAGVHQQAYTYTLKAEEYASPRLFLEKARLHWLREEHEEALITLRRGLEQFMPDGPGTSSSPHEKLILENRKIVAEAKLLIASYNDSISNVDTDVNTQHYKESVEVYKEWEKSLVCLAQYYDRIFQTYSDTQKDSKGGAMQIHMINYFGKSLQYGSKFVYQSMPRLLSIWFDYGTRLLDVTNAAVKEERLNTLLQMTNFINMFLERLPAYIFLTAFSQLVSRICHPQKQVYIELKSIIIKLILQYPQQSLWMMISVIKSSNTARAKRCAEILNDSRLKTANMIKFLGDFTKLAEKLIELCNKEIPDNVNVTTVSNLLRTLPRLLTKDDFSEIMIPTQKFRKLVLPNPDFQSRQHNPFPNHYVHIIGIEDEVTILQSMQHPRRITFRGSDGKKYMQMLKPKDDLRKDFRLMEFNDIVNQLLSREADSRQRRLNIRLYSVVPLNEECGLIEWVPNLIGLRPVLLALYKQIGMGIRPRELKQYCCNQRDSLVKKREIFTNILLPKHPPVFGEWFRKTFPDAQGWLTARTAYIRTTAVISMVGYILGLGDRHGENILFDSTCGDTMHVDFNCLFNKGEALEWPERVPFRLTQNMVAAMGPLGVEGDFRKSCACTLRVLRSHSTTLMSIVTPFVYDPLLGGSRNIMANTNGEQTNKEAVNHIRNIELRLQGMIRTLNSGKPFSIPLSVEGQTNNLIQEAISIDNLCQMYFGWGPYL